MVKVNNKNKSLEILKDFGFKRKRMELYSGNSIHPYYIWENKKQNLIFVYNTQSIPANIEVWEGGNIQNYVNTIEECIMIIETPYLGIL